MNNTQTSELVALNVATHAVDGRLTYAGKLGTTYARGDEPWLLEQRADLVAKLDRQAPWRIVSSWNVALGDRTDGGDPYADPYAVVVPAGNKGYVLRYTRNAIAVIDPSQTVDGGAPVKTIDLGSLVQSADGDGLVDMTTGFYVASRHMLYVLLANIDKSLVSSDGFTILCAATTETLVGIDVTTDQVTSLGGTGVGGGIALTGYNPAIAVSGVALAYDAANDRAIVVHAGCNAPAGDGGVGALQKRVIEGVALATGQVTTLLDANALGYPGSFAYVGPHDALVGFGSDVFRWDPAQTTIGAKLAAPPDAYAFVYDGTGALLGTRTNFLADGGSSTDVVKVPLDDAGVPATLATNPFTDNTGFVGGVELWAPAK
jgi:hypothetical protein